MYFIYRSLVPPWYSTDNHIMTFQNLEQIHMKLDRKLDRLC